MAEEEEGPGRGGAASWAFKHEALRRRLGDDIAAMRPGEALPTERLLAERYRVSRSTARRALQSLREEGLIRSVRGVGTFVAHPHIVKTSVLTSFTEDLRARGHRPGARLLAAERVEADLHLATALGVDPGTALHRIERLRLGDEVPFCLETVHLSAERFPGLDPARLSGSLSEELRTVHGVHVVRAGQQIRAVNATGRRAALLGVPEGSAALLVRRTAFDAAGRVVEYGESLCRGDRYEFSFVVNTAPPPAG
ncbi:GntR family transcriptional regulator [Streptomyces sp. MP131-18]|uniref:GntR family transcriptional regulator n=1 Tax=Streptomyces sp. MP131-18 TaxID=1857892 RepID=UPI0009A13891|nr:GntR family transcriptional regulator [Streptomyces sp. MP131-18]ONK10081.1 HTH-type transcriptional repressor DasR [Streptomyces sp. MP131-18]